MNLILWRHAEAEEAAGPLGLTRNGDLQRALTRRGHQQAQACAKWLRAHAAPGIRVLCSPAVRARETAAALTPQPEIVRELVPGADVSTVLAAVGWPEGPDTIVVGHQPWLGRVASLLLAGSEMDWSVRKSGIWWLASRTRENEAQVVLRAVVNPEFL
ncbi:histidine phosphatase family protein [Cupriavidus sp. USMAA2-4]|uniref:Histidine phosphatase family protein n=1 Tax=Cupriavidus malaysiensis TaxID=367825 RepID=A0ABN4TR02_9BURK|nr:MULTISPECIES: histidine phosphatase family protein [Cupriavidus]AOY93471.1 histidine phosphatase family protein [Cupriavidus sp. USMAA2-4]AOZ00252.1 histidine phosphatase family protein [Cupriavidus sp. USMAHM13]AOZ06996.1 histidine phosphatase family protein [Cupriavidus malaysiensis]